MVSSSSRPLDPGNEPLKAVGASKPPSGTHAGKLEHDVASDVSHAHAQNPLVETHGSDRSELLTVLEDHALASPLPSL